LSNSKKINNDIARVKDSLYLGHLSIKKLLSNVFGELDGVLNLYRIEPFDHLKTKRRLLYVKTQSIPRSKHFSSRL